MKILAGSHASLEWQNWGDRYGGGGCLYSPPCKPNPKIGYYAIDNGKFVCWSKGAKWDSEGFVRHVEKAIALPIQPQWIVVPDEVGDRDRTLELWDIWYPKLSPFGIPLAFAVQNGMSASDIPFGADIVFVGGTFAWKWRMAKYWCDRFPRVHVARVNSWGKLCYCQEIGAESVDGTGWFRGKEERHDLHLFLAIQAGRLPGVEREAIGFPYVSPATRSQLLSRYLEGWRHWHPSEEPLWKFCQ